jgi:hypothetical protein
MLPLLLAPVLASQAAGQGPVYQGDPEAEALLGPWLEGALRSTGAFGAWPDGAWTVFLHETGASFERATGAAPGRAALWLGPVLHLRPWQALQRRDPGALLRHELTHRRLRDQRLPVWKEEALCLWAELHTRPPEPWPAEPTNPVQARLDSALASGTLAAQRWAYAWLRAWLEGRALPEPPARPRPEARPWQPESAPVVVVWPPERLPARMAVDGQALSWRQGARFRFEGEVRFGPGCPVSSLEGTVALEAARRGWKLTWTAAPEAWVAAAAEGELGEAAPVEAKRALASVLWAWLKGHPAGNHPDGTLCPLTHCAVIRGSATTQGKAAAAAAPEFPLGPGDAFFTGSKGGVSLSPREVWGSGASEAPPARPVPGDRWASWTRRFTPAQVRSLKAHVRPGLRPGQRGLMLGPSGPYAVEDLRLEAGRRFGWTAWPSNACEAVSLPDGSLELAGHGWGHNAGLCLATAVFLAGQGATAEAILADAFGEAVGEKKLHSAAPPADP